MYSVHYAIRKAPRGEILQLWVMLGGVYAMKGFDAAPAEQMQKTLDLAAENECTRRCVVAARLCIG